jgi:hypothetical protein
MYVLDMVTMHSFRQMLVVVALAMIPMAYAANIRVRTEHPNCNLDLCEPGPLPCPFPGASEEISEGCWTCCHP